MVNIESIFIKFVNHIENSFIFNFFIVLLVVHISIIINKLFLFILKGMMKNMEINSSKKRNFKEVNEAIHQEPSKKRRSLERCNSI